MDRLTARRNDNGLAYLVGVKPDEQEVESPYPNTLRCILDCFERLATYEDIGLTPEEVVGFCKELEKLTPGGSEFYNDPGKCLDWVKDWLSMTKKFAKDRIHLRAELEQVKRERDAAIEDLKGMCEVINSCAFCIHDLRGTNENWPTIHCNNKDKRKCWIWRGFKAGGSE
jgi:hypothetical protein